MNENIKKNRVAWLEALRSGEYNQGKGCLRNEHNEFCCLGVACNVLYPNEWEINTDDVCYHRQYRNLPHSDIFNEMGLTYEIARRLAGKNDGGDSFEAIADYLETEVFTND